MIWLCVVLCRVALCVCGCIGWLVNGIACRVDDDPPFYHVLGPCSLLDIFGLGCCFLFVRFDWPCMYIIYRSLLFVILQFSGCPIWSSMSGGLESLVDCEQPPVGQYESDLAVVDAPRNMYLVFELFDSVPD